MFEWIKSWFMDKREENTNTVNVHYVLPNGEEMTVSGIHLRCKQHPEYTGKDSPINNCNECWEFHSKVVSKWEF